MLFVRNRNFIAWLGSTESSPLNYSILGWLEINNTSRLSYLRGADAGKSTRGCERLSTILKERFGCG